MVDFIPFGPLGGQKQDEGGKKKKRNLLQKLTVRMSQPVGIVDQS